MGPAKLRLALPDGRPVPVILKNEEPLISAFPQQHGVRCRKKSEVLRFAANDVFCNWPSAWSLRKAAPPRFVWFCAKEGAAPWSPVARGSQAKQHHPRTFNNTFVFWSSE